MLFKKFAAIFIEEKNLLQHIAVSCCGGLAWRQTCKQCSFCIGTYSICMTDIEHTASDSNEEEKKMKLLHTLPSILLHFIKQLKPIRLLGLFLWTHLGFSFSLTWTQPFGVNLRGYAKVHKNKAQNAQETKAERGRVYQENPKGLVPISYRKHRIFVNFLYFSLSWKKCKINKPRMWLSQKGTWKWVIEHVINCRD